MRTAFAALALVALGGCSGNIVLTPLDPSTMGQIAPVRDLRTQTPDGYKGLIVYLPTQVKEVDQFIQVQTMPDGKTVVLNGDCKRVETVKVVTVVDRSRPFLLQYHHGLLEAYTFAATLTSDGALASIDTTSTPDQGKTLANLASTVSTAAGAVKAAAETTATPLCTQTPVFVRYEALDPIPQPEH
jgi:hypothetical protein